MAITWTTVDLAGGKDGNNVVFTVPPTPDATTLLIIFNGRFLYRVTGSPAADEYVQAGTTITLGLAPNPADQVWCRYSTTGIVLSPSTVPSSSRKNFYWKIELRNKNLDLIEILQPDVNRLSWEYATVGGCGECEVSLRREFDRIGDIDLDYDVQVWRDLDPLGVFGTRLDAVLPFQLGTPQTGSRELRYSGFVREITPVFDEVESVRLRCSGYSRQLEYLAVVDNISLGPLTMTGLEVAEIVRNLVDSGAVLGTKVKRTTALALVQDTGVIIQELTFNGSIWDALKTLAEIGGNAEVGVRADREIYFTPRQNAVKQTYNLGNNVKLYESTRTSDDVVNWVYLQGADGTFYKLTNGPYQSGYQKERVVLVPAISQPADAALWGIAYFARFGTAQPSGTLNLAASDDWIENVGNPIGLIRIFGGPIFIAGGTRLQALLPIDLGKVLGATTDQNYRIASINYTPAENGLRISIQLGERSNTLADQFRNIEHQLSALRLGLAA